MDLIKTRVSFGALAIIAMVFAQSCGNSSKQAATQSKETEAEMNVVPGDQYLPDYEYYG
ncbi:MAG: hypothetical protein ABFS28_03225 [Bacteroidota bacterium]